MTETNYPGKGLRWLVIYFAVILAVLVVSCCLTVANAQTPPARTATVTFQRPTHYTDGTAIPSGTVLTYKVYQGTRGASKPQVGTITATATTINTGLPAGETCWQIVTVANGVDSALSNEGCKSFPFPTEAVTITVT